MKMQNFRKASPGQVEQEKENFRQWLLKNGYDERVASDYVSRWSRVDQIVDQLGYESSILATIVGLKLAGKLDEAADLTLALRDNLKDYYRKVNPTTKAWNDVATSLNKYANDYLLGGNSGNVGNPVRLLLVRNLAANLATLFTYAHMRNVIRGRLTSQNRGNLPMKNINSTLSKYPAYKKWLNNLVDSVIFIGYVPIDDPYIQNPVKVQFKDISKLLIDQDQRVLFRKKNDSTVYTLLTPIASSNSLRPAKARKLSNLEIDHEPAISVQLQRLQNQIPNIQNLSANPQALLQDLILLHSGIELRIMEDKQNHKKGAGTGTSGLGLSNSNQGSQTFKGPENAENPQK